MKRIRINADYVLVCANGNLNGNLYFENKGFSPGPAIRRRDENPYAPENFSPSAVIGRGITQAEYDFACEKIQHEGTLTLGPYIM